MTRQVKVLQVGMTDNVGGMETYLIEQYRHINHNILTYDFVNITADRPMVFSEEIRAQGGKVYNICRRSKNFFVHYWQWYTLLVQYGKEYDAVTLNACHLYYVFPLVIAKLMGIKKRIMHSHNTSDEIPIGFFRKALIGLNRKLLAWAATDCWACSTQAGKWMFGDKPFAIIHNAIDIDKFSFKPDVRQQKRQELGMTDKFVIGHVGRFTYQKNHEFIIDVFSRILKKRPNAILLLVGDAVNDETYYNLALAQVTSLHLVDNVKFLGMRHDVPELMQAMDCFVLPSRFEGLPLVGLEAQAAGLPCYFADTITRELQITALAEYLPLGDTRQWTDEILSNSNYERQNMTEQLIAGGYDINTEVRKVEELYLKG